MTHRDDSAVASLLLAQGETAVPILIVDWSGEDEPGQIVSFVRQRAAAFGVAEIEWTDEDTEAATAGAERGDHVPWLLTALDESIGSVGLALSLIASGNDQYEVVVSRLDDVAALRELQLEGSAIVGVGEECEAQLVNVVCADCNAPHMWELSDGVTLDDTDVCEVCGATMFDASGKALPGVVVS